MAAGDDSDWTMGCAGGGSGGCACRAPECVFGEGGGVGRLNLSGLVLLLGEGLCLGDEQRTAVNDFYFSKNRNKEKKSADLI